MAKSIVIDRRLDSYQSFFDHAWARVTLKAAEGTPLEDAAFGLCVAWREAANAHYLPWLMIGCMDSLADRLSRSHEPFGQRYVAALGTALPIAMGGNLTPEQSQRLDATLRTINEQVHQAQLVPAQTFDGAAFFQEITAHSEVQFSLHGSQQLCYAALYHAYEHFLLRVYKTVSGKPDYRIRGGEFSKDFAAAFDAGLRDYCWSDPQVNVARLARHALAHNGGRVTDELSRQKPSFRIEDGEIHILPADTRGLYDLLKERVTRLATAAVAKMAVPQ